MGASQSCAWCGEMGGIARGCYVIGVVFCEDSEYTDKVVYAKDGSCPTTDAAKLLANIQHSTRTVVLCSVRARQCLAHLHQSCLSARVLRCVASHRTLHPSHNKSRYVVTSPSLGGCRDRIRNGVRVAHHQDLSAAFPFAPAYGSERRLAGALKAQTCRRQVPKVDSVQSSQFRFFSTEPPLDMPLQRARRVVHRHSRREPRWTEPYAYLGGSASAFSRRGRCATEGRV